MRTTALLDAWYLMFGLTLIGRTANVPGMAVIVIFVRDRDPGYVSCFAATAAGRKDWP